MLTFFHTARRSYIINIINIFSNKHYCSKDGCISVIEESVNTHFLYLK